MPSLNKATIMGHLGANPDIRSFQDGNRIATFSVATSRSWKDKTTGERKEKTTWHNVVLRTQVFVDSAEKYLSKGDLVYIEGEIEQRSYEKDGITRYVTDIVVGPFHGEFKTFPSKVESAQEPENKTIPQNSTDPIEDEIPF